MIVYFSVVSVTHLGTDIIEFHSPLSNFLMSYFSTQFLPHIGMPILIIYLSSTWLYSYKSILFFLCRHQQPVLIINIGYVKLYGIVMIMSWIDVDIRQNYLIRVTYMCLCRWKTKADDFPLAYPYVEFRRGLNLDIELVTSSGSYLKYIGHWTYSIWISSYLSESLPEYSQL